MTPLERAARAICEAEGLDPNARNPLGHANWTSYISAARAVLLAIREPSDAMREQGYYEIAYGENGAKAIWQRMIDVALEEGSTSTPLSSTLGSWIGRTPLADAAQALLRTQTPDADILSCWRDELCRLHPGNRKVWLQIKRLETEADAQNLGEEETRRRLEWIDAQQ